MTLLAREFDSPLLSRAVIAGKRANTGRPLPRTDSLARRLVFDTPRPQSGPLHFDHRCQRRR
ncbi:MAG: hypothetical protein QOC62_3707 [Mycobacterium sp.]|jgi:hypothetical protein|nr:hypothetical protein [Mycobacterium sp.]